MEDRFEVDEPGIAPVAGATVPFTDRRVSLTVKEGQPDSPTARQPDSPTARQPDSPTARQPDSPTARQPDSPTARQPDSPTARQPDSPTARRLSDRSPFGPSNLLKCGVCGLAFLGISATPAHAYLDPGTGSIILQGLIAGLAAAAAYLSIFGSRVKTFLKRFSRSANENGKDAENN